ncbi:MULTISPECIES: carbohydrate ABC transporter permease [Inquilinus]|uniref:sn-glycerol-3-phosphate transport system permease protein UgpE n=1 Tax=Inquilinus ginsengisoli TaxID=363840 RepID=A0ABU1K0M7_9PROT|nr:carbohydrate ABC transporter permease [Inquilinus ginsengisoli]MDR6294426.1 multiple sugar transport system permease protein [Inquilinus ginsengisoli]
MMATALKRRFLPGIALQTAALLTALLFLAPIAWTALSSVKPAAEANLPPLPPWPTTGVSADSYTALDAFGAGVGHYAGNSLTVAIATASVTAVVSLLGGYGFSRFRFPGRNALFVLVIATIMIPFQSILTPLFLLLTKLGLQNTLTGLVLIYVTLQLPFSIFMMRNAFDAVPREIEEAARIDGAGSLQLLARVMLPLVFPGVVTVALFAFLAAWNEFLAALILLSDQDKFTLPILMTAVRSGRFGAVNWGAVQAGVTVMMVPCLLLFLALQRFYIRGLTAGAVK